MVVPLKVHTAHDSSDVSPIFVVGNSRSGTTLMARMLGRNSEVHYLPETHFFGELWDPNSNVSEFSRDDAEIIVSKLLARVRDGYYSGHAYKSYVTEAASILGDPPYRPWEVFCGFLVHETRLAGKRIPCEQTPRNLAYVERILARCPGCRAICMIRDPRDVLLSQKRRWRRRWLGASNIPLGESLRAWANYHPISTSHVWNSSANKIRALRANSQCLVVRYEDLVEAPEKEIRRVMTWLGLQFEMNQLRVPQVGSSAAANAMSEEGVRKDRVEAWRHEARSCADLRICQDICGVTMKAFGYEPFPIESNLLVRAYKYLSFPGQVLLASALNMRRRPDLIRDALRSLPSLKIG